MTQLAIIVIYLALLLGLALFSSRLFRGTTEDYMLASHTIGPVLLLMSLFGTTMTAFALVGSSGEAFKEGVGVYGMLASSSAIVHPLCFFVVGVKLWAVGRRYGYRTQIQFFRERLESDTIGLLLFPCLVGLVIPYLLIGVMSAGTVINSVTEGAFRTAFAQYDYGVPPWLGSLVISVVVLVYVFFGGMRGTAWANTMQTLIFMVLGVVTFAIIANRLGGLEQATRQVLEQHPSKVMRSVTGTERHEYESAFAAWRRMAEANYAAEHGLRELTPAQRQEAMIVQDDRALPTERPPGWESLPLAHFPRVDGWQSLALETYAGRIGHPEDPLNPDQPDGERKWTRKKALGVYRATHWAPESPHGISRLVFFTYLLIPFSAGVFPHLFQHWLTARSASSFKLPIVAHPIFIMIVWVPCVLVGMWATSATVDGRALVPPHFPANAVLAHMVRELTGPVLGGLLTAGILAAIMSSLDSQFLSIGSIFTNDVVLHYTRGRHFTEAQMVLIARLFVVGIVAVTYGFSLFDPRRVFTLGVWTFSGFSALFPLVVAALYWKRLTLAGAVASIAATVVSWCVLFHQSNYGLDPDYAFLGMMPVATIVACSTTAMIGVSFVTRAPSAATLAKFFD